MKSYTVSEPVFSNSINIVEVTDPGHADLLNEAPKQLLQNDLIIYEAMNYFFNLDVIENDYREVYQNVIQADSTAMTPREIEEAISTKWKGEASEDSTAMTPHEIEEAISTKWKGEASEDSTAMTPLEIEAATKM